MRIVLLALSSAVACTCGGQPAAEPSTEPPTPPVEPEAASPAAESNPEPAADAFDPDELREGIPSRLVPPEEQRLRIEDAAPAECTVQRESMDPDEGGLFTRYSFDRRGRLVSRTKWGPDAPEADRSETVRWQRGRDGRARAVTVALADVEQGPSTTQHRVRHEVDGGQIRQVLTPADEEGLVGGGTYRYDGAGRVVSSTRDQGVEYTCSYAGESNRPTALDGGEATVTYFYDDANRLLGWNARVEADWNEVSVVSSVDDGFVVTVHTAEGIGGRTIYRGGCVGVLLSPCSTTLAPVAP